MELPGGVVPGRFAWALWELSGTLLPEPNGTNPDDRDRGLFPSRMPQPVKAWCLLVVWLVPVIVYWLYDQRRKQVSRILETGGEADPEPDGAEENEEEEEPSLRFSVLLASIEHSTPWTESAPHEPPHIQKVQAGGLGVVVRLIAQHHPRATGQHQLWMVHPMVSGGGMDYGPGEREPDLQVVVDGHHERVEVFRHEHPKSGPNVKYLLLGHRLFTERRWKGEPPEIYPSPMTRTRVLCFYALWNQAVGQLLRRHKPAVYHCPDFHAALAPWLALASSRSGGSDCHEPHPALRVLLVLHNAEYQGSISTDMAFGKKAQRLARIFDVSQEFLQNHMVHDGRLNLLKAGVDFCALRQGGRGVCAVSDHYAEESEQLYDIFWRLPLRAVRGLANPMLEEERARLPLRLAKPSLEGLPPAVAKRVSAGEPLEISATDLPPELRDLLMATGEVSGWLHEHLDFLQAVKAAAKVRMQRLLGLCEDPQARLFVSLGRIVRQKGIDLLAEVAEWLLSTYGDAQLVVVGPDEDGFGAYARVRLEALQESFHGRMFCYFQFWRVPQAFKLAADFCLMPSRDEPFGYVDVEFAWNGAIVVGAQVGGLGKVPGIYYVAQNRESLRRLQRELRSVLAQAMEMARTEPARVERMSREAVRCSFPLARWRRRLLARYGELVALPPPEAEPTPHVPRGDGTELGLPLAPTEPTTEPPADLEAEEPGGSTTDWSDDSWLVQELSELELKDRIVQRLRTDERVRSYAALSAERRRERIDEILEVVGTEEDKRRERQRLLLQGQGSWLSEWLLERTWGVHRIHGVVASGFVLLPVGQLLAWVVATEWGIRSTGVPKWVPMVGGPVDRNVLQLSLFVVNALPQAGCTLLWAHLCKRHQAKTLLAWAMMLNLLLLIPFVLPLQPHFFAALSLMVFAGMLASSSLLFVVFNFMMSIRADLSQAALRMGRLEIAQSFASWMVHAFLLFVSPSKVQGTQQQRLPYKVLLCILPLGLLVLFSSLIPGLLVLHGPRPYREDRFPGWGLKLFARKPSFVLLTVSDCLGGLAAYPSSCYLSWWLANGHSEIGLGWTSILIAVVFSISIGLWARALSAASVHGFSLLVAVVVFMPPPSLLRALAMEEVSTLSFLGTSDATVVLSALTVLFEGVRSSAVWAAKIRILGSRWRLLSWGSFGIALQQGCTFLSPVFCELIARISNNSTFLTRNQKELADAMIASIWPLATAQYAVQLLVILFIHRDLGLLRLRPRADREAQPPVRPPACRRRPFARRKPVVVAGLLALAVLVSTLIVQYTLQVTELPYSAVRRCYNLSNTGDHTNQPRAHTSCSVLFEHFDAWEFGLNQYGQATTARWKCGQRMRSAGGDTFALVVGQSCKVMLCGSLDTLRSVAFGNTMEVFSRLCDIYGQNLVIVHLFEWSWDDVAQECRDYLGPAGFDAVQVSPPADHMLGPMWFTRYQPVSYALESRSGTEQEFIHMVSECRSAGVAILVDAVLNHMAGPLVIWPEEDKGKQCDGQGKKFALCKGWTGTRYGDRQFEYGSVKYGRDEFHHYQDNVRSNCAIPPFYNNRHLCDLNSLPDLDTEQLRVQSKIVSYLQKLYEIGVTMFRIDAAMCIYPASLARMLEDLPLDYVYQEYYAELFNLEKHTMENALTISPVSDFNYGWQMAEILFDYKKHGKWVSGESNFGQLLELGKPDGRYPDGVLPAARGLQFVDNHDQQRDRWKTENGPTPPNATCDWDGSGHSCRPIYKHGLIYNLAQLFTLAWPRGDSVQLMSSFAWTRFDQGPPGTNTTLDKGGQVEHVWRGGLPAGCRKRPDTSPVSEAYDADRARPWVCEHRWEGVAGLVRLRKSFGKGHEVRAQLNHTFSDGPFVAFGLDTVAFLALHRGYNTDTQLGSNKTWNLTGLRTGLPLGRYCDLARESGPVPPVGPGGAVLLPRCTHVVSVSESGNISSGQLESGGVLAVHRDYRVP